ncbi:RNA polymerase II C-terminal domain phosphatase-like 4, partial [Rosa rugosa]|uniref:RNA polymerase II C-terminal domain phosphatase-like 4 n=1 Tax=Rosa rugosa TaxID=74645 RepID=UPI002B40CC0B
NLMSFQKKKKLDRKLHLVLNLDHIFLTYTNLSDLTPEEEEFLETLADSQEVHKVQIPPKMKPMIIKFRPSLRNFLKEASGLFEIYAYTNAPRPLVWKIVELLDPRNEYFGRRVITPDYLCSTHEGKKCLNPVLGQESAVLVVDYNLCGWKRENRKNVQVVSKYSFFKKRSGQKRKRKSLCELKSDEGTECLVVLLRNLKRIHSRFFVDEVMFNRDVRMLLKIDWDPICEDGRLKLWKRTLSNCMQKKVMASLRQQKKIAGQSSRTTYVKEQVDNPSSSEVAGAAHVERSQARWIHPSWIDISIRLWQKGHVGKFPLILKDSEFTCSSCGCSSFWNTGISLGSERKQHMCPSEEASIDPSVERES